MIWVDYEDDFEDSHAVPVLTSGPSSRDQNGLRWFAGMFLGWFLVAGAGASIWYLRPDLIDHWHKKIPASPNASLSKDFLIGQARADMAQKNYGDAYEKLKNKAGEDEELVQLRGEALWLKYLQEKEGKGPPRAEDQEVVDSLKDLNKDPLMVEMIKKRIEAEKVPEFEIQAKNALKDKAAAEGKYIQLAKVLEDNKIDIAQVEKEITSLVTNKLTMETVNNALTKAGVKEPGEKGVGSLVTWWKDLEGKFADVNTTLDEAKIKEKGVQGVKELSDARNELKAERDNLDAIVTDTFKQMVAVHAIPAGADPRKDIKEALKKALVQFENPLALPLSNVASTITSLGTGTSHYLNMALDNVGLLGQVGGYKIREPFINGPEQRLDTHLALMKGRRRQETAQLEAAQKDALWLLSDANSITDIKIKAHFLIALINRNQQKFDEARQALDKAIGEANRVKVVDAKKNDPIMMQVRQTKLELTDASVFYLRVVEDLQSIGKWNDALNELNIALLALPQDPRLSARRALVQFQAARTDSTYVAGKIPDKISEAIRTDAGVAIKDAGAAAVEATYALGLLDEELGNWSQAEKYYDRALELPKGSADLKARILKALGRVLQRERSIPTDAPANLPESRRSDKDEGGRMKNEEDRVADSIYPSSFILHPSETYVHPFSLMVASLVIGQPIFNDDEDPAEAARLKKSVEVAKKLMESDNPKHKGWGNMLMGQALAKQGRRTEGLRLYVEGLKLVYPGDDLAELVKMVEEHPFFQQPDVTMRPNPMLAEYHFSQGRQLYFDRKYSEAEAHLKQAVTYFDQDARYLYFLGLAQVAQCTKIKRDAADLSFIKAGKLEAQNKPHPWEVNISLERIQGPLRQALDRYRIGGINTVN